MAPKILFHLATGVIFESIKHDVGLSRTFGDAGAQEEELVLSFKDSQSKMRGHLSPGPP